MSDKERKDAENFLTFFHTKSVKVQIHGKGMNLVTSIYPRQPIPFHTQQEVKKLLAANADAGEYPGVQTLTTQATILLFTDLEGKE